MIQVITPSVETLIYNKLQNKEKNDNISITLITPIHEIFGNIIEYIMYSNDNKIQSKLLDILYMKKLFENNEYKELLLQLIEFNNIVIIKYKDYYTEFNTVFASQLKELAERLTDYNERGTVITSQGVTNWLDTILLGSNAYQEYSKDNNTISDNIHCDSDFLRYLSDRRKRLKIDSRRIF